jgi:hypothetical protein
MLSRLVIAMALALVISACGRSNLPARSSQVPHRAPVKVTSTVSSSTSPQCIPASLNQSAVLPGTPLSVSPLPGTMVAEP